MLASPAGVVLMVMDADETPPLDFALMLIFLKFPAA